MITQFRVLLKNNFSLELSKKILCLRKGKKVSNISLLEDIEEEKKKETEKGTRWEEREGVGGEYEKMAVTHFPSFLT